ncbi:hypothetical protein AUK11_01915 [bacterium CG2_30_37_16]|nr:MAG: hypothetical protein AUK11_01915 [bacterium CG2_30_37_16]PIP31041.1 MAG: hypothetical protein COX25_01435 [bacterium (Candidatus Howlettbacteria) CG23_combo_of_CG06-09_8_20_14_all_37_9]PIX98828.1 MAG: hypothetical protein COZ22_04075 [bacterium (Candidatus Howlettbacteria) CG_4_10_14_3_um_filter_37_10]PJB06922.1 MAG: hypothetical protein CO123_01030 [bacterium (Candidatus Howlettbacteria) CG_4_9_14_3_um_filter_37_10]
MKRNPKIYRQYQKTFMVGPISLSFITISVVVVLSLLYMSQSSKLLARNYDFDELDQKKAQIELETAKLETEVAKLQSITEIQKSQNSGKNLEQIKKINYLPSTSSLALK